VLTGPLRVFLLSYGLLLGLVLVPLTAADDALLCLHAGLLIPLPWRLCTPTAHPDYPSIIPKMIDDYNHFMNRVGIAN